MGDQQELKFRIRGHREAQGVSRLLLHPARQRHILIEDGVSGGGGRSEEASTGVMRIRRATMVQDCMLTVFFGLFYSVPSPRRQV